MAHCNLCNRNTRCSCKWGGCPSCWSTNKQVSFLNDLIKFWTSKDTIKQRLSDIKWYTDKIDSYTYYEYMAGLIDEEKLNEAIANYKTWKKKKVEIARSEVVDTTWRVNPKKACVFKGNSPWDRCIYCNSIRRYMTNKECLKYEKAPADTEAEKTETDEK